MYDSAQQHNSYEETARQLAEALGLTTTPIALAFVDNPPPDVPTFSGTVPSACAFWPEAEQGSFYASAAQHANCPLGAHVMGFPADESQQGDLQSVVEKMCGCEYIAGRARQHPHREGARDWDRLWSLGPLPAHG